MPYKDPQKAREMGRLYKQRWYDRHRRHPREYPPCPPRVCQGCGRTFERQPHQRPARFQTLKFCSAACDLEHRSAKQTDEYGRAVARRLYLLEPCETCGSRRSERHHIDSNRLNNARSNIAFLCRLHHKAAHKASDGRMGGGARPTVVARQIADAKARAKIARELRATGMTWKQVAEKMGYHVVTVHLWMRKYPEERAA